MKLIDANELENRLLTAWYTADKEKRTEITNVIASVITPIVVGMPTAYDIDKVVEQLEEERDRPFADCNLTINGRPANDREIVACKVGIKYATEIVKGGGVDE